MKCHEKQLASIPQEMRILPLPPNEEEAEETKKYIRERLGLSVSETPVSKIFLANEIIERASIMEGRIGEWEGLVAFVLLYRFNKQLKTIYVVPRDGIDAREIAKAILWGYLSDLPPRFASSDIVSSDRFFQVRTFNLSKLGNMQILEKFKRDYQRAFSGELMLERSGRRNAERELTLCVSKLENLQDDLEKTQTKLSGAYDDTYRWNLAAVGSLALLPLFVIIMHCCRL